MNTTILKKCIDELKKDNKNVDYVLGMLETLYEMQTPTNIPVAAMPHGNPPSSPQMSEAEILDARARASIKTIKEMGTIEVIEEAK